MDYTRIYNELITYRKNTKHTSSTYVESHHIIPKSMGGTNTRDNLVMLSYREHFIAHLLLWKIHRNKAMAFAVFLMTNRAGAKIGNSHTYSTIRDNVVSILKGRVLSEATKLKIGIANKGKTRSEETIQAMRESRGGELNAMYGKTHTEEAKLKQSEARIGTLHTEETIQAMRESRGGELNAMYGKTHTEEAKLKQSEKAKNRKKITCPHCGKVGTTSLMHRWHFSHCKLQTVICSNNPGDCIQLTNENIEITEL